MISVYIDNFSHVLESIEPLYEKGDKFSIGFSKTSETSFEVYSHLNQHGEKLVRYIVDITQYEQGKIHSLYFIPNYKTTIPNDRVLDNVQMHLSEITAMKAEYFMKMKGGNYNTVAFYIIPGTNDCVVYTRMSTLFEGIEPIITQESDIHAIIGGVYHAAILPIVLLEMESTGFSFLGAIDMTGLVMDYLEHEVGGLENMKKINAAKAKVLYDYLDGQDFYRNPVQKEYRSMMNVTFTSPDADTDKAFCAAAAEAGFVNLKGHRLVGGMRASIYNAMPPEGIDKLVDFMEKFRKEH